MSHQSDLISTDINAYLAQHERKELLRFLTCGNVDDGKSTLIGRLLHDSKMIYEDQLAAVQADSVKSGTTGAGKIDLALLVDGLQAEREQGITIDVAYRYFSTSTRKFIIADTPGHEQYTRNMATGASTCDLAIILIDARYGVQTQTKRHSFIASLLGIKHVIVAINKMDLVEYSEAKFEQIKADYLHFIATLDLQDVQFIPMSALDGDNVVNPSENMAWFTGVPMMEALNTVVIAHDRNFDNARFPVQYVNRPNLDFRGFCGTVAAGVFNKGDLVTALPSGKSSKIKSIVTYDGDIEQAFAPMSVTLTLEDEIDVSRGDMLVGKELVSAVVADKFKAHIVWMTEKALTPGRQYVIKLATRSVFGSVSLIHHRIDVNTLEHHDATEVKLNEIGCCTVSVTSPVVFDAYKTSRGTGSFIIIDRLTNGTVGAGMIIGVSDDEGLQSVSIEERASRFSQTPAAVLLTGADSATVAYQLERKLFDNGHATTVLETANAELVLALKNAGLVAICTTCPAELADSTFDTDTQSLDDIHGALKEQGIIH
ncbi:sulfate adenylyltransferase subunit CysN [Methylovulum psychrotolerans]|uniref:Sulfate adenylyltransferase subunit 1 n=1 Tax=Methylovulum psychrotolerans TaxID=1704499 RepID=A0A1Z4BVH4_9GAMM|nr:sulfate adenylyltransferase subunit CysN [Methylovulum psychrotolerans]ASF45278.1 sulfate adenylyltransferase subunit CysN [Methylovulum psychrotolerans]MBT9096542.1 sulfate adenylyltransferase subunit CysN [Methylovulum psychrotolerans]